MFACTYTGIAVHIIGPYERMNGLLHSKSCIKYGMYIVLYTCAAVIRQHMYKIKGENFQRG